MFYIQYDVSAGLLWLQGDLPGGRLLPEGPFAGDG